MDSKLLVETVADHLGRKTEAVSLKPSGIRKFFDIVSEMDDVVIPAFGTFEPRKRNERVMVHPSTKRRMLIPPKVVLGFKVSNVLKSKLK